MKTIAVMCFLLLPTLAHAASQDTGEVRVAYANLTKHAKRAELERAKASKLLRNAKDKEAARKGFLASLVRLQVEKRALETAFARVFAKSDWKTWNQKRDAGLLESGLMLSGQLLLEQEAQKAILAFTRLLERFPKSRNAVRVRTIYLPNAFAASGRMLEGTLRLGAVMVKARGEERRKILLAMGDLSAAAGDTEAARKRYEQSVEKLALPMPKGKQPRFEEASPRIRKYAELRLAHLGKPAPNISSKRWIGGYPRSLGELRGKVVVLDFWATWCQPCRRVMPALNRLHREHASRGLVVLGVTRYYDYGYLPADPSQMLAGGQSVRPIAKSEFEPHLAQFRDQAKIAYPFVIVESGDFKRYGIGGIPTVFVIDKKGIVRLVAVGGAAEPMVRAAVKTALDGN